MWAKLPAIQASTAGADALTLTSLSCTRLRSSNLNSNLLHNPLASTAPRCRVRPACCGPPAQPAPAGSVAARARRSWCEATSPAACPPPVGLQAACAIEVDIDAQLARVTRQARQQARLEKAAAQVGAPARQLSSNPQLVACLAKIGLSAAALSTPACTRACSVLRAECYQLWGFPSPCAAPGADAWHPHHAAQLAPHAVPG